MAVSVASLRRWVALLVVGAAALAVSSCGDDGGSSSDSSSRESEVYTAIVRAVAADEPQQEEQTPIVYVTPFPNDKAIPLDVQVSVVDSIADDAVVRFVDDEDQAINKDAQDQPVIDDAVLVRLGPVPAQGTTVTVPAELYVDENHITPTEYKVTEGADGWVATQQSTASG